MSDTGVSVLAAVWSWRLWIVAALLGLAFRWWRRANLPISEAELEELKSWDERQIWSHRQIERLADDLWIVQGLVQYGPPRTMTIFALPSGGLLLYSAVALHADGMRELESLGDPEILVVPSHRHQRDALRFKTRYPRLRVYASDEDVPVVRQRIPDVMSYDDDALAVYGISVLAPVGVRQSMANERVLVLPVCGGRKRALVFCDLIFNLSPSQSTRVTRVLGSGPFFGVTRIGACCIRDRHAFRQWLEELGTIKRLSFVLVTHGDPVIEISSGTDDAVIPQLLADAF